MAYSTDVHLIPQGFNELKASLRAKTSSVSSARIWHIINTCIFSECGMDLWEFTEVGFQGGECRPQTVTSAASHFTAHAALKALALTSVPRDPVYSRCLNIGLGHNAH